MADKTILLITGANTGIGYEAVKLFLRSERPYHIILGARTLQKAEGAVDRLLQEKFPSLAEGRDSLEALAVDLSSDESIQAAFESVSSKHGRLDVLLNNAGAGFDADFVAGRTSLRASFNDAYDTNVSGTHVLTHTLVPLLLASKDPRLLFPAGLSLMQRSLSGDHFPSPPAPAGWPKPGNPFETIGYRCSKTAMNMLMLDWHHKLRADGVKVWSVRPGFLQTGLGGDLGEEGRRIRSDLGAGADISEGGISYRQVVEGERDADVGKIVQRDGGFVPL